MTEPSDDQPAHWLARARGVALQVAVVIAVLWAVGAWQTRHLLSSEAGAAPDFTLRDLDGGEVRLSALRGKAVLVHFWATWCGVCKLEHGALNAVHADLDDDQVLLSVVADADDVEAVRSAAKDAGIAYPVLLADERTIADFRVGAFPTNYFIRPDGSISSTTVGMSTRLSLKARLALASR